MKSHFTSRKHAATWALFSNYSFILFSLVTGIIMIPFYLRYIPLATYGAWLATGNTIVWITALDAGISTVLQQHIAAAWAIKDIPRIHQILCSGLFMTCIISLLMLTLGLLVAGHIQTILHLPPSIDIMTFATAFKIAIIGSTFMVFSYSLHAISKGLLGGVGLTYIYVGGWLLSIGATILLIIYGYGIVALAVAVLARGIVYCIGIAIHLYWQLNSQHIGLAFTFRRFGELCKLISFTSTARMTSVASDNIDNFMVNFFLGPEAVAVYDSTKKVAGFGRMLIEWLPNSFLPTISHLAATGDTDKVRRILLRLLCIIVWSLGLFISGLLTFNGMFVQLWIGHHLFAGPTVNTIICLGTFLVLSNNILLSIAFALGDLKRSSAITSIYSLCLLVFSILGCMHYKLLGVAMAPVVASFIPLLYYLRHMFYDLFTFSCDQLSTLVRELLNVIFIHFPLYFLFCSFAPNTWSGFLCILSLYSIMFLSALYMTSGRFRDETMALIASGKISILGGANL